MHGPPQNQMEKGKWLIGVTSRTTKHVENIKIEEEDAELDTLFFKKQSTLKKLMKQKLLNSMITVQQMFDNNENIFIPNRQCRTETTWALQRTVCCC